MLQGMYKFEDQKGKVASIEERIKELENMMSVEKTKLRIEREILEEICFHEFVPLSSRSGAVRRRCRYCKRLS